jgi:ankyrin repeat protein
MSAAWQGMLDNARILLDAGAQIDRRNKDGNSALGIALDMAPKSAVHKLLLKRSAKVGLIESLLMGDRARALAMIRSGAELNVASPRRYTPLMIACEWGDLELVRALLNRGAKTAPSGRISELPLFLAACGRDEIVDEKGPGYRYRTEWFDHGKRGNVRIPILQELLARGVNVHQSNDLGQTALERASAKGDLDIMSFLVAHGADPNYVSPSKEPFGGENRSPLVSAAEEGHLPAVELLLAHGAKVNGGIGETRKTALSAAVSNEHVDIVRLLLSKGADPTIRNWDGWTILQIARERKNQAIIDLLAAAKGAK